jgi:Tfp pilus assembly protein PilF
VVHRTAAMLLRNEGKLREARDEITSAIRAWEETGRTDSADYASLLIKLGALYIDQHKYPEARTALHQALLITEAAKDAVRIDLIHALHTRAVLHAREREWRQAEERFLQALKMIEQETRADPVLLRSLLSNYATLLRKTHRGREARSFEKRAAALPTFPTANALVDVAELLRE